MLNLFRFIARYHFFFLFLLLEAISLALYFSYNYFPQAYYFRMATSVHGAIREQIANIDQYFSLKRTNEQLAIENAILRSGSQNSFLQIDTQSFWKKDTLYLQQFKYTPARVVANSIGRRNNFIMIDKGTFSGVMPDMGVIGPQGVVGIVVAASEHFASVMSMLHSASTISVKLKKNNEMASVIWEGKDPNKASLINLSSQVKINKGDTIITSGYSLIFPEGIMVGTIDEFEMNPDDIFYSATIRLSTRFSNLSYVYVVQNLLKNEQQSLVEKQNQIIAPNK
ncbi:MAG: rod shape-determining protein MreC [Bacteroidales bacterium]